MTITLTPEQEALINQKVANGDFATPQEVIMAALRFIRHQSDYRDPLPPDELRRELMIAVEQEARGEYALLDAEEIKAAGRKLLSER